MSIFISDEALVEFSRDLWTRIRMSEEAAAEYAERAVKSLNSLCEADDANRGYHLRYAQENLNNVKKSLQQADSLRRQANFVNRLVREGRKAVPLEEIAGCAE